MLTPRVVITIVVATASPYAAARFEELPNPTTNSDHDQQQQEINQRHVDLSRFRLRCEFDLHPRQDNQA